MLRTTSCIYDKNFNFLSCKVTELAVAGFCWKLCFCLGRPDMMLTFLNFFEETVMLRMFSSTSLESFSMLGENGCNSWYAFERTTL